MLWIYTPNVSKRVQYTFNLIFKNILQVDYLLSEDLIAFEKYKGPKMAYANQSHSCTIWFKPHGLLNEKNIRNQKIEVADFQGLPSFFHHQSPQTTWSFDPFACIFYLSTRYEEYLPFKEDMHGRFPASASLAYQQNFLHLPLVDLWVYQLKQILENNFPHLIIKTSSFTFKPSYDVDYAWAFKHKGIFRQIGAIGKSILKGELKSLKHRIQVICGIKKDPYDNFDVMTKFHGPNVKPIYFFLIGPYGKFDKNNPIKKQEFQQLIKKISHKYSIGIHPSYASFQNKMKVEKEIHSLSKIIQQPIENSRQHYLRFNLPSSFQVLIDNGIKKEFSMAYPEKPGFRASIARPYLWYNLKEECSTSLTIHPFQIMDVTFVDYLKCTPDEAFDIVSPMIDVIKKVNGTLMTNWHNNSFEPESKWDHWRTFYHQILLQATDDDIASTELK